MSEPVIMPAPAKLNLALAVGPRREDGMHPICSWMIGLTLADDLTLTRLDEDRLSRYAILWHEEARRRSDINWSITRDLAVRAHVAMERHVGRRLPVQMKLEKRIPVGGGLGGGSSNAAAMLRALNQLFKLELSREALANFGAALGSDVPFMVGGGSAIVEGTGDTLEAHEHVPTLHVVLVFPEVSCPTAAVYGAFDELACASTDGAKVREAQGCAAKGGALAELLFNDLTPAAMHVAPALREHMRELAEIAERPAHLTGSGSTMFIVCDDALYAEALSAAIEARTGLAALAVSTDMMPQP